MQVKLFFVIFNLN